jgi:hypothetical protein
VDDVLASVRGVVDLSPQEALDEAQDFLTRQGYSVTYRTTTTLTVKRQVSDNASGQESIFKLIVMALPQSGGGVRIKVRGNDREAVRDHQAAWLEWSETLPKRETEQPEAAATTESVTRETVRQEAPRHTTAADNDVPQRRYCSNCGHELADDDRFCANCGTPVHEAAHVPTPEADRWGIPPAAERNAWERLIEGQQDRIAFLERELERRGDETVRLHQIVAGLTQANAQLAARGPELEAPQEVAEASQRVEEPEKAEQQPRSSAGEAQEREQRPWWRRVFGS